MLVGLVLGNLNVLYINSQKRMNKRKAFGYHPLNS
jgi:hypothetical protein